MIAKPVVPGLYSISMGIVNAFLIDDGELTLIDTGIPGSLNRILLAMEEMGKKTTDLKHILGTHLHVDHIGSLAALKKASGAVTYMHPLDAEAYMRGQVMRPAQSGPGLINRLVSRAMVNRAPMQVEATEIDQTLQDGQVLDFAGGLQVIHAPGHTAGQVVFLWPKQGGVLFSADTASHMTRLGWAPIYEDLEEGRRTLQKLGRMNFNKAVFSHGSPITAGANRQFRAKFGS